MPTEVENSVVPASAENPHSAEVVAIATEPTVADDPFGASPEQPANDVESALGLEPEDETSPAGSIREAIARAELPSGFDSIAHQLPKAVTAKLKQLDTSTAILSVRVGAETYPDTQLAFLIAGDFAANCVQMTGLTGMICCTVKAPKFKAFHFAFHVQASSESQNNTDPMQVLAQQISREFQKLETRHQKQIDDLKLEIAISGSGGKSESRADVLAEMKSMFSMFKDMTPATQAQLPAPQVDITGQMKGMVDMFRSVAEVQGELRTTAGVIAKTEKSFAEEAKEILEIPLLKDVAESAVEGVKLKLAGKSAAANPSAEPSEPDVDPFAAGAA